MNKQPTNFEIEARNELAKMPGAEITVTNQQTYEAAGEILRNIATVKKAIKEKFADPKKKAAEAHKAICNLENELLQQVTLREQEIRQKMTAYWQAEQARIAAEEARKREEAEKLLALAQEAEAAGETDMAMEAVSEAALQEATVTYTPKAAGVTMRKVWEAVVTDKSKVPLEYMEVNLSALNQIAKATKGTLNIPGVQFMEKVVSSVRSR